MTIHHLNCGSLCPHGARWIHGSGGVLERSQVVCHCLAIETGDGIVLVDTGFGLGDARNPRQLGLGFRAVLSPRPREETTALRQLEALGFGAADVRHIVPTHLDVDHAGGLPDFPEAEVHISAAELAAARHPSLQERSRYIKAHTRHRPRWVEHTAGGDSWFGFESVRILPGLDREVVLVPLPGHSRGHSGVAVRDGDVWLLHCGDAYFHHSQMATPPSCPPALRVFQNVIGFDNSTRRHNEGRLRELAANHGDEVRLFSAHDPAELALQQAETAVRSGATGS